MESCKLKCNFSCMSARNASSPNAESPMLRIAFQVNAEAAGIALRWGRPPLVHLPIKIHNSTLYCTASAAGGQAWPMLVSVDMSSIVLATGRSSSAGHRAEQMISSPVQTAYAQGQMPAAEGNLDSRCARLLLWLPAVQALPLF